MSPFVLRLALVSLFVASTCLRGAVVLNEIHYHPVEKEAFNADGTPVLDLTEDVHEFIELHNSGAIAVSLDGWILSGGVNYTFPPGSQIPAGGFQVVAGNPDRMIAVYALPAGSVLGPWTGHLSNRRERVRLENAAGVEVDAVEYRGESPWPISADALGAGDDWTGLRSLDYQYRGRSLERVSATHPSSDPSNWLAAPLASGPSPGKANAVILDVPRPVVLAHDVRHAEDGSAMIRAGRAVRVECVFTEGEGVSDVRLEWFREDLNVPQKSVTVQPMWPVGSGLDARFQAEVPGQTDRSVIRYRIRANRGAGDEVVSPRADDPFAWHGWFVTPVRSTTLPVYDMFISRASLTILRTNIASEPRRVTRPDPPGRPRASWNATQPALFIHEGRVYDVQMRHHGSQFRRDVTRKSYKVQFPDYARFEGRESVFLTDKDQKTTSGHTLFRAAGLPTSRTWRSDLYLNSDARLTRLAQEEYDGFLLERYLEEAAAARGPGVVAEPAGEFYKSQGIFDEALGPYGFGNGVRLRARVAGVTTAWTPLQRYEWTYTLQMHGWKGHRAFGEMLTNLWTARNNGTGVPTGTAITKLRTYFDANWDLDKALTHVALFNWQGVWDDTMHNYFLWQQANGKWAMLPWDFDDQFETQPATGNIFNGNPFAGPNYFKQSLVTAFRNEFRTNAWWLNNTLLDPDNLPPLGLPNSTRSWAVNRQRSVNTQLQMGFFTRPLRPTNSFPEAGAQIGPGSSVVSTAYRYNTNPIVPHAASVWQFRDPARSWLEPVLTVTNSIALSAYTLTVGPLVLGRSYGWRVQHLDAEGHPSPWSAETRMVFGPEAGSAVLLNEALAVNTGSVRNGNDRPDYLELVNRTAAPVELGGWAVSDSLENPSRYVIPDGTQIPANGYLILWCDSRRNSPGLHTGFGLRQEGETVGLFAPGPSGLRLVDLLTFGPQLPDLAVGRISADSPWTLVAPSPAVANTAVELDEAAPVRINEWLASGADTSDWFELFHPGSRPVDLGGLLASDGVDDSPLPPLSFIAPGGFLRWVADGVAVPSEDHLRFRLSGGGGSISLRRPDGRLVDRVFYPRQQRGISQGRVPDGAVGVYPLARTSPAASNLTDSDGDGMPDVWEQAQRLNPFLPDAAADADGDLWINGDEYRYGFDPQNAASRLHLTVTPSPGGGVPANLSFLATPEHGYAVERQGVGGGGWQTFQAVPSAPTTRTVGIPLVLGDADTGGLFRVIVE
ncbi:MAG: hypothetical protein RIS76_522 [Verrucomicrobiota bacterium]